MDPEEKNSYHFLYSRNTHFPLRYIGLFAIVLMFAAIPVVIMTLNQRTQTTGQASELTPSPEITPSLTVSPTELVTITPSITDSLSPTVTATITPSLTDSISPTNTISPSASPTAIATTTVTPTPTNEPSAVYASLIIKSLGIGANEQLLHPTKAITITLLNVATQQKYIAMDTVTYNATGSFTNTNFKLGDIPAGTYQLLLTMPGHLQKFLTQANKTNTFVIQQQSSLIIPALTVVPGDIASIPGINNQPYGDNILDISDYNVLIGCYSESKPPKSCSDMGKIAADLNDDDKVNAIDYNILLRSFATRSGDSLSGVEMLPTGTTTITYLITPTPMPTYILTPTATKTPTPTVTYPPTATPTRIPTYSPTPLPQYTITPTIMPSLYLYNDTIGSGWQNWSWDSTNNFSLTSPVYSGARAISFKATGTYGALYFYKSGVSTSGYTHLHFAAQAVNTGGSLGVIFKKADGSEAVQLNLASVGGNPVIGSWKVYDIPLSTLGVANMTISGLIIQDFSGTTEKTFYIDDIRLIKK